MKNSQLFHVLNLRFGAFSVGYRLSLYNRGYSMHQDIWFWQVELSLYNRGYSGVERIWEEKKRLSLYNRGYSLYHHCLRLLGIFVVWPTIFLIEGQNIKQKVFLAISMCLIRLNLKILEFFCFYGTIRKYSHNVLF